MSIESVMPSNRFILCRPLLLLPSILPSIRVFSNESVLCIRWPKHWSFSLSISPSNDYSGLISFRIDWLDLLEVQGTLKSLLQHHSSKATQSMVFCYSSPSRVRYYLNYELLEDRHHVIPFSVLPWMPEECWTQRCPQNVLTDRIIVTHNTLCKLTLWPKSIFNTAPKPKTLS